MEGDNYLSKRTIKFSTLLVILSPFLGTYKIPYTPITIAEGGFTLLTVLFIIYLFRKRKFFLIREVKYYLTFIVYILFVSILVRGFLFEQIDNDFIFKWGQFLVYSMPIIFLSRNMFDFGFAVKYYTIITMLFSILVIIQFLSYNLFHFQLEGLIPFLNLNYPIESVAEYHQTIAMTGLYRPSSVFIEPAHFAQYASIGLALELFFVEKIRKSRKITAFIITVSIFLSGSGIGFVLVFVNWMIWFYREYLKRLQIVKGYFVFFVGLIAISIFLSQTSFFENFLYRVSTIGESTSSTGSLRVLRGYNIFLTESHTFKIFGIGLGNVGSYLRMYGIRTPYDGQLELGNEYMNSLSYILVISGIIGFIIFTVFLISIFRRISIGERVILIDLIVLMSVSAIFLNPIYTVCFVLILASPYNRTISKIEGVDAI
mgnify:CR=1 FL=1